MQTTTPPANFLQLGPNFQTFFLSNTTLRNMLDKKTQYSFIYIKCQKFYEAVLTF